jgi:hypothetical protein
MQETLDRPFLANPSRFGKRAPKAKVPPERVAINLPCGPAPPPIFSSHPASHAVRPSFAATEVPDQATWAGSMACPLTTDDRLVPPMPDAGCRMSESTKTITLRAHFAAAL